MTKSPGCTSMQPGDFVITPSWTWHDHGNETAEPMVWLDGLDIQIVKLMSASFAEQAYAFWEPIFKRAGPHVKMLTRISDPEM